MDRWLILIPCFFFASLVKADDIDAWYKNGVIYQVYVRSFQDSDGDGFGDLRGIIQRAAYLESLGIKAIWLSPIYPTPNADFGYDIADFDSIDPTYGTLEDFNDLVKEMNSRGMKVIMDFIPNHTSIKHPWFVASEAKNDTDEEYSDFYIWRDPIGYDENNKPLPPTNWLCVMSTGSAWEWSEVRKQFYLHTFLVEQADLNYENPRILKKMNDVLKVWMRRGVMGFRTDAVSWLYDNVTCGNEPASPWADPNNPNNYGNLLHVCTMDQSMDFDIVKSFRRTLDTFEDYIKDQEPRIMMTESYTDFDTCIKYYGEKDDPAATFPFNFGFVTGVYKDSDFSTWSYVINRWMDLGDDMWPNWVVGNHDQRRVSTRFGSDEWVDLFHIIMMTLKGTVMTYYGEELGLNDNDVRYDQGKDLQGLRAGVGGFGGASRDFERGPMPWDGTLNGGYTNGTPWLPMATSYRYRNTQTEDKMEGSHLNLYRFLVKLRQNDVLSYGSTIVNTTSDGLLVITRHLLDYPTILTVVNLGDFELNKDLHEIRGSLPKQLKVLARSSNYINNSTIVNTTSLSIPPKSGAVLETY